MTATPLMWGAHRMADERNLAQPLLVTEGLGRNFGGLAAVHDVSLSLSAGELHAVIGPNGAGKSTLVNLLAGEITPSTGRIVLAGVDVTRAPAHARAHHGIGRSFQRTNIFMPLTVLENVRLAAQAVMRSNSGWFRSAAKQRNLVETSRAALQRVGLERLEQREAGTLSHGGQRQLEIAMALASNPKVILLDEPLAGMGPEEGERIALLLRRLACAHAILLIEHDMDFVFQVADRMTVMVDGQVLASGTPAAIRADARVQNAYLGGHA
jgi:branched-chain amino acid transport system ATP-binding protein